MNLITMLPSNPWVIRNDKKFGRERWGGLRGVGGRGKLGMTNAYKSIV